MSFTCTPTEHGRFRLFSPDKGALSRRVFLKIWDVPGFSTQGLSAFDKHPAVAAPLNWEPAGGWDAAPYRYGESV